MSIFKDKFFAPLLAKGWIVEADFTKPPSDLAQAVAILAGRDTECYIDPRAVEQWIALVRLSDAREPQGDASK